MIFRQESSAINGYNQSDLSSIVLSNKAICIFELNGYSTNYRENNDTIKFLIIV